MYRGQFFAAQFEVEQLIDLTGALLELTTDMSALARVPEVLARSLDLGPLGFALVDMHAPGGPAICVLADYGTPLRCPRMASEMHLRQSVLARCQAGDSVDAEYPPPTAAHPYDPEGGVTTCPLAGVTPCGSCWQVLLTRQVGTDHHLFLMINSQPSDPAIPPATLEALHVVLDHFAKSLHIMMSCQHYPPCLGAPFTALTRREWMVLCSLNTTGGEKEIAARFGVSPHTLHAHVKNIYRKLGVQGRLALLRKFRHALQNYRLDALCTLSASEPRQVPCLAV
ncbi:MAG: helix-turn-helix transcriptional regulator [Phycisphaerae bacterium]